MELECGWGEAFRRSLMIFRSPEWLLLLPVLVLAGWFWKRLELFRPRRLLIIGLLTVLLMRPAMRVGQSGMDLWVLLDRSDSAEALVAADEAEWRTLLEKSKQSKGDRLIFVDYASESMRRGSGETSVFSGERGRTRTGMAIEAVLAEVEEDKASRLLVFSDGYSTAPLGEIGEKLLSAGVAMDYRLLRAPEASDYRVTKLGLPARVQVAEPFVIDLEVRGAPDVAVPVVIYRNGHQLEETTVEISGGKGGLRFRDRIGVPGSYRYEARIAPTEDAYAGNNRYETWIEVAGGPRVLLATKYTDDPLEKALKAQGFDVETVMDLGKLGVGKLAGCRALVLNNVPAFEMSGDFLAAVDYFVRHQGGGFLMAGGKQSFGAGGYFDSAVDSLLPVSMELKNEHRKLSVAMAIVMDRSGSMGMTVPGGKTKMDLANEGAGRVIDLLGAQDQLCVFAVDSEPHVVVKLDDVGGNKANMAGKVRRVQSMGGGIYCYNGLEAGWKALKRTRVGLRHTILFSDARDTEQQEGCERLVKEMVRDGGTLSVIGLGTDADQHADFLKKIAKLGQGRAFITDKPQDLPNLFAQETVTVARSAFVTEPTGTTDTGRWFEIAAGTPDWLDQVGGYNLSYLREKDSTALVTTDEYVAPLVAFGKRGAGRTAAISFPLGGEFSDEVRAWPGYGDFLQTMSRWLMGEELPPGLGLRTKLDGTRLTLDLLYEDSWSATFAKRAPEITLAVGEGQPVVKELVWQRMSPGHFSAWADLEDGEMYRGAVSVGESAVPFGPLSVGSDTEWGFDPDRPEELRAAASVSGGGELLELKDAWRRTESRRLAEVRWPLLIALLLVILLDALITRTGWSLPVFEGAAAAVGKRLSRADRKKRAAEEAAIRERAALEEKRAKEQAKRRSKPSPIAASPDELPVVPKGKKTADEERRSRFKRAKRGK